MGGWEGGREGKISVEMVRLFPVTTLPPSLPPSLLFALLLTQEDVGRVVDEHHQCADADEAEGGREGRGEVKRYRINAKEGGALTRRATKTQ